MASPPIEVWSLRAAQSLAARIPGRAVVCFKAAQVDQAPALLKVLRQQRRLKGWEVRGLELVKALAAVDVLLTEAVDAHLLIVRDDPSSVHDLCALRDGTWEIQTPGTAVTGNVARGVKSICKGARRLVVHALKRDRSVVYVAAKALEIRESALKLKTTIAIPRRPRRHGHQVHSTTPTPRVPFSTPRVPFSR